jgi:perosamine synthetase
MQSRHAVLTQSGEGEPSYYSFPVILESGIKDVKAYAKKKEIETLEAFEGTVVTSDFLAEGECPNARSLAMRTLLFPLNPRISGSVAQKIIKVLATLP